MKEKNLRTTSIGKVAALISITSFLSYVIGLLRDRIIAVNFGTTEITDIYNASFIIPDFIFNIFIAGALAATFMPVFTDYLGKNKQEAYKIADTILTAGTITIGVMAILAAIFMHKITPIIFNGVNIETQQEITSMTRIMLLASILFTISNALGNILMVYRRFLSYALSPILYNAGIIGGVIFLSDKWGIYSAAIGVVIGGILHLGIRAIDVFAIEYKYKPRMEISHPGFKKIIKLMIPQSITLICVQLNLYIFSIAGMKIVSGGLAAFNFARNIKSFPVSLFGIAFATAVFPYLTTSASIQDKEKYTFHIQRTIQQILFFTIPAMVGIMILSTPIVNLILSGGVFQENSTTLTSLLLFFFAISIPFESIMHILGRSFYALQNTKIPMLITACSTIYIAISTFWLSQNFGIEWLAINTSIAFAGQVVIMAILLRRHLNNFNIKEFLTSLMKIVIASGIMATVLILSKSLTGVVQERILCVIQIIIGGGIYMATAAITKSKELSGVNQVIARLFNKKISLNINSDSK